MPTHKSAEKRIKTSEKARIRNRMIKSAVKTAIKKVLSATKKDDAAKKLREAAVLIDKAAQKGIFHPNNASRKKSNLAVFVNKLS